MPPSRPSIIPTLEDFAVGDFFAFVIAAIFAIGVAFIGELLAIADAFAIGAFFAMPPSRPNIIPTLEDSAIGAFIAFIAAIFAIGAAFIGELLAIGAFFAMPPSRPSIIPTLEDFAVGDFFAFAIAAIFAIGAFFAPPRRPSTKGSTVSSSTSVPSLVGSITSSIKNACGWCEGVPSVASSLWLQEGAAARLP